MTPDAFLRRLRRRIEGRTGGLASVLWSTGGAPDNASLPSELPALLAAGFRVQALWTDADDPYYETLPDLPFEPDAPLHTEWFYDGCVNLGAASGETWEEILEPFDGVVEVGDVAVDVADLSLVDLYSQEAVAAWVGGEGPLAGNVVVLLIYDVEACPGVLTPAEYLDLVVATAGSIDARHDRFCGAAA